jgi:hypothetical protein
MHPPTIFGTHKERGLGDTMVNTTSKQRKRKPLPLQRNRTEVPMAADVPKSPLQEPTINQKTHWRPTFAPTPNYPGAFANVTRRSPRLDSKDAIKDADGNAASVGIMFEEKKLDGKEAYRELKTLKALVDYNGPPPYTGGGGHKERFKFNNLKRVSQRGGAPSYDLLYAGHGSAIYVYSLPLAPLAVLLQGLKNETAVAQFKKETKALNSFPATNYMFLHWDGGIESSKGNYKSHNFVKVRPGLALAIESLGNYFARRIILNPKLGGKLQPGMLCNNPTMTDDPQFQPPHWDFIGWRKIRAKDMPWVVHIPLCKEGMMLHVWPTDRDEVTHSQTSEKMKLGKPSLVHVSFGDALVLRADVCHGGCFGSTGNMRFHMVLRNEDCALASDHLHFLDYSGVDRESYKEKELELQKLVGEGGTYQSYFRNQVNKKSQTVVAYTKAMEALYPEADGWCEHLIENVTF